MRRLFLCALASLALYFAAFAFVLDRPLSLGMLRLEMDQKTARGAALPSPKLVILAGSNGPYSHSCMVIGAMLRLPCENAGIAVGIGLDDLFARWAPILHRRDIVYLPMEVLQYTITRAQNRMAVDGASSLRHDLPLLWRLGPDRTLGAAFANTLPDGLEALAEMAAHAAGFGHPRALLAAEYDADGDRIDTPLAAADHSLLAQFHPTEPGAKSIAQGYGTKLFARFVRTESARGVIMIGGLPTDFDTVPLPVPDIAAISASCLSNGGEFLELPNHSRYPPEDFFNSEDHLARPRRYLHSIAISRALGLLIHRRTASPTTATQTLAATCPLAGIAVAQSASVLTNR